MMINLKGILTGQSWKTRSLSDQRPLGQVLVKEAILHHQVDESSRKTCYRTDLVPNNLNVEITLGLWSHSNSIIEPPQMQRWQNIPV